MIMVPGYWTNETSGVLHAAVGAYLFSDTLSAEQIAALRAYFRQWIAAPGFSGPKIEALRQTVDGLTTLDAIDDWLDLAIEAGVDPL
jgi:hypothetical protein